MESWLAELGWIARVGFGGLAVLVIGWLVVSFSRPSPRREIVEWISACGMYTALLMLFVNLCLRANAAGSTVGLVAFGLLVAIFGTGFVVCAFQMLRSMRGPRRLQSSATN